MAEFQWWLLIVGLVAGGGVIAAVYMDTRRREVDVDDDELRAEATWIAGHAGPPADGLDATSIEAVLRAHRDYLALPTPDRLVAVGSPELPSPTSDGDADDPSDNVGDGRRADADEDLAAAREEETAAGEQADAGSHRKQRRNR
jgi:hypothetical protein